MDRATRVRLDSGPEMEIVLLCARVGLDDDVSRRAEELLAGPIDWGRVVQLATWHKMLPLLYWNLKGLPAAAPFLNSLHRFFAGVTAMTLSRVVELKGVVQEFRDAGIPVVPHKGPVLSAYLYGNMVLRQVGDIDVVVRRSDVDRAREILVRRGYVNRYPVSESSRAFRLASRYCEEYTLAQTGINLELHWAFTNGDVYFPVVLEDLLPSTRSIEVDGHNLPLFGDEDLLLILSVHGAKHRWDRLEWICGIAALVQNAPKMNWDNLWERSTTIGCRRTLALALKLAHDLLDAPVPDYIMHRVEADEMVIDLAHRVPGFMEEMAHDDDDMASLLSDVFHLQIRERVRDRLRFIAYRVATPSRPDQWRVVRIGSFLVPVHTVSRLIQLATRVPAAAIALLGGTNRSSNRRIAS
jgi:hypothetical protein